MTTAFMHVVEVVIAQALLYKDKPHCSYSMSYVILTAGEVCLCFHDYRGVVSMLLGGETYTVPHVHLQHSQQHQ